MFAEGLFALMEEHGLFTDAKGLPKLPCFKEGWSPEDSTLDEAASAPGVYAEWPARTSSRPSSCRRWSASRLQAAAFSTK